MLLFLLLSAAFALNLGDISGARYAQLDASVAGLSVLGELLLSRKKRETWIVFALAYGVGIYTYVISGLFFTAALCGFLLGLCLTGWRSWRPSPPGG
jgi:nicotinamide riboside transporter PnuC